MAAASVDSPIFRETKKEDAAIEILKRIILYEALITENGQITKEAEVYTKHLVNVNKLLFICFKKLAGVMTMKTLVESLIDSFESHMSKATPTTFAIVNIIKEVSVGRDDPFILRAMLNNLFKCLVVTEEKNKWAHEVEFKIVFGRIMGKIDNQWQEIPSPTMLIILENLLD